MNLNSIIQNSPPQNQPWDGVFLSDGVLPPHGKEDGLREHLGQRWPEVSSRKGASLGPWTTAPPPKDLGQFWTGSGLVPEELEVIPKHNIQIISGVRFTDGGGD